MLNYAKLVRPASLAEAYEALLKNKLAQLMGGTCWLRLGQRRYPLMIDLSGLDLQYIREDEQTFFIGAMTTQGEVLRYEGLQGFRGNALQAALKEILGVQFRNCATMGGSVAAKFGFSDIIPVLLAMRAEVVLYEAGKMPLADYLNGSWRDILLEIQIPKIAGPLKREALRKSASDFPHLTGAVSRDKAGWQIVIGARPAVATRVTEAEEVLTQQGRSRVKEAARLVATKVAYQTNSHASAEYRRTMAEAMVLRMLEEESLWI